MPTDYTYSYKKILYTLHACDFVTIGTWFIKVQVRHGKWRHDILYKWFPGFICTISVSLCYQAFAIAGSLTAMFTRLLWILSGFSHTHRPAGFSDYSKLLTKISNKYLKRVHQFLRVRFRSTWLFLSKEISFCTMAKWLHWHLDKCKEHCDKCRRGRQKQREISVSLCHQAATWDNNIDVTFSNSKGL